MYPVVLLIIFVIIGIFIFAFIEALRLLAVGLMMLCLLVLFGA